MRQFRSTVRASVDHQQVRTFIAATLTSPTSLGQPLAEAWNVLEERTNYLTSGNWLSRRVDGYIRVTEITHSSGRWHPHLHLILVLREEHSDADVRRLSDELNRRWCRGAEGPESEARDAGQKVQRFPTSDFPRELKYVTKTDVLRTSGRSTGLEVGDILQAAYNGDADSYELWQEIESASKGRRMLATGGLFRPMAAKRRQMLDRFADSSNDELAKQAFQIDRKSWMSTESDISV